MRDGGLLETPEGQKPLKVFEFNKHTPPSVLAGLDPSRSASTSAAAAHPNHASASAAAAHPNQNRTPTAAKRHKLIQDFQSDQSNGGARVFIVTYATAAVGITLTAANRIFLMEPCPDPGQEAQAAGRIHRLGQTKEVFVKKYCFRESIEETIVKLHEKIKSGDVKIVDGKMVCAQCLARCYRHCHCLLPSLILMTLQHSLRSLATLTRSSPTPPSR